MTTENEKQDDPFAGFVMESYKDGTLVAPAEETKADALGNDDTDLAPEGLKVEETADDDAGAATEDDDDDEEGEVEDKTPPADETNDQKIDRLAREKAKKMAQGRIGKLTAQNRDLERRLVALEGPRQQEDARQRATAVRTAAKELLKTDPNAPKSPSAGDYELGEFDSAFKDAYADYLDERSRFLADAEAALLEEQSAPDGAAGVSQEFVAELETFKEARGEVKGFKEAMAAAESQKFPVSYTAAQFIVSSDVGAEIAVHLHQNPKLANEIAKLPEVRQAARLGKLEDQLLATREEAKQKKLKPSAAPAPVSPSKGGGGQKVSGTSSPDFAEAERAMNEANRRK